MNRTAKPTIKSTVLRPFYDGSPFLFCRQNPHSAPKTGDQLSLIEATQLILFSWGRTALPDRDR